MRMGRRRARPAATIASTLSRPRSRAWFTASISTIDWLTTMPASMIRPIYATTLTVVPVSHSAHTAPMTRERDGEQDHERMDQRLELRRHHEVDQEHRKHQRELQRARTSRASLRSGRRRTPSRRQAWRVACRMSCSAATPVPRSAPTTSADTMATRSWPMRRISAGPLASVTSATAVSGHRPLAARVDDQRGGSLRSTPSACRRCAPARRSSCR